MLMTNDYYIYRHCINNHLKILCIKKRPFVSRNVPLYHRDVKSQYLLSVTSFNDIQLNTCFLTDNNYSDHCTGDSNGIKAVADRRKHVLYYYLPLVDQW